MADASLAALRRSRDVAPCGYMHFKYAAAPAGKGTSEASETYSRLMIVLSAGRYP
jgi:hypothetical protein